jgi:hypothetical protein
MTQRHKPEPRHASRAGSRPVDQTNPTGGRGTPIALLAAAGALTVIALVLARGVWTDLPLPKLERVDANAVVQAFRAARTASSGEVRNGNLAAIISSHFTTALEKPDRWNELFEDARAGYRLMTGTQVSRLQLAALTMLRLQRDNVPIAGWWPTLEPYLTGLENASFGHFLPELLAANAAVYVQLGLAPGSARRSAQNVIGYPHGPFLEYFAEQMERVARTRQEAGDAATAATCRRLVQRLLRQWVLDPAPSAVRLLAAQLLIGSLEAGQTATAPAAPGDVVRGLREWRTAYTSKAAQRPTALPLLSTSYAPVADPAVHDRLASAVAAVLAIFPALLAAAVVAVLVATPWVRHPSGGTALRAATLCGVGLYLVLIAAGWTYLRAAPESVQDDLRRLTAQDLGWPHYPFLSAGATLVVLAAVCAWPARGRSRWVRTAACATTMCILMAVELAATCLYARAATAQYEVRTAALLDGGEFDAIAGPQADRQLDPLRAWQP